MSYLKVKLEFRSVLQTVRPVVLAGLMLGCHLNLSTESLASEVDSQRVTTSLYGKAGLLDMPSGLFFDPGHLSFTGMLKSPDNRVTLNFQPLPWFEGSFRYSIIKDYFRTELVQPDLFDRSFDIKVRVSKQHAWWPAVAVGIQDIGGTGLFSSEFVAATWQTEHVNFTGGFGFGRFASRKGMTNPLTFIFDSAKSRDSGTSSVSETGQVRFGQFFRGEDMGVFGGIEYFTPIKGLKLIAEYSSDAYPLEVQRNIAQVDTPFNFGLSYRFDSGMEIGAAFVQGNTFSIRLTAQTNPIKQSPPPRLDKERFQFKIREMDMAPDVVPFAGESELYKQYSALQVKNLQMPERQKRDFISSDHVWNPWLKSDGIQTHVNNTGNAPSPVILTSGFVQPLLPLDLATDAPFENKSVVLAANSVPTQKDREALARALSRTFSWPLSKEDKVEVVSSIRKAADLQGIGIVTAEFENTDLTVYYSNWKYNREPEAIGRLLAVVSQAAPDRIETFHLVSVTHSLNVSQITVPRSSLERIVANYGSAQELFNVATFSSGPTRKPGGRPPIAAKKPSLHYGLSPSLRYSLFDPDDPMRYQVSALANVTAEISSGFYVAGLYRLSLYDNFDEITRTSNSVLPHVRSDFPRYLNDSEHGVESLTVNYVWQPGKDVYARAFGGVLEEMYAGIGAEVLYRPYGARWAVGLEVDYVQQREFDRTFSLRDYKVATGFAKWYYNVPYEDLRLEVNVGRYLAKDIGATFKISRTFDNGTEIGAFATLTDVPFDEFGEGSFDKGIIIKIPFHAFSFFDTRRVYSTVIKPLTRDGGAQVWSGMPLYSITDHYDFGRIRRNWRAVFK